MKTQFIALAIFIVWPLFSNQFTSNQSFGSLPAFQKNTIVGKRGSFGNMIKPDVRSRIPHGLIKSLLVDTGKMSIEKTGELVPIYISGGVFTAIKYSFKVTNTGVLTLNNINIKDPQIMPDSLRLNPTSLAPGESGFAETIYLVSAADFLRRKVVNSAIAYATDEHGYYLKDWSDDPTDPTNREIDLDGEPDDSTITLIGDIFLLGDTCIFVNHLDTPFAPIITLNPEVICGPSIITIHINGTLLHKGAKWVIYTAGCGTGVPIGSTRGNIFVDASLANTQYFVREEACVFLDNGPTHSLAGACGSAAIAYNLFDTDGDGTLDCYDGCPNDPAKTSLGICGCGVPDLDTDLDGIKNCIDPDDDNDGIADINDNCPLAINVDQKDIDLDGIGDVCDPVVDLGGAVGNVAIIISTVTTSPGINKSLTSTLDNAVSAYCKGNLKSALNSLNTFKNEVLAQSGKKIPTATANQLLSLIQAMITAMTDGTAQCPSVGLNLSKRTFSQYPNVVVLYPNPATHETWLDLSNFKNGFELIQLSDIKGLVLQEWNSELNYGEKFRINLDKVPSGFYMIRIQAGPETKTFKLIVK